MLGLPDWAAQVMMLECEPTRSGPLPAALTGIDALSDAFPLAQPTGNELIALTRLRRSPVVWPERCVWRATPRSPEASRGPCS